MEPNGKVSIVPKESYRNVTPKDIKLTPKQSKASVIVILDGVILEGNLRNSDVDKKWILGEIKTKGAKSTEDVALASLDNDKNLTVFLKNNEKPSNDYFE